MVEEHGWQFTFVFDPEGLTLDFGYSVGFTSSLGAPEFIIFGLPRALTNSMLWEVYKQIENEVIPESARMTIFRSVYRLLPPPARSFGT